MSRPAPLLLALLLLVPACDREAGQREPTAVRPGTSTAIPPDPGSAPSSPAGTSPPTQPTSEPVTTDGDCRYLETTFVEQTVGQRIARTTYTATSHELLPGCTFYRPDGDPAVDITVTAFPTAVEAQTAAIGLGTPAANPVDDVGDGGVVLVTEDAAVLAVTVDATLLVVTVNQASSLQARALAVLVAPLLS